MENIRGAGCAVGEYVGGGQGNSESVAQELAYLDGVGVVDAMLGDDDDDQTEEEEDSSDDSRPLLIFYDVETTGFSVYNEHITDIAAQVVACPVPLTSPTFSSLVKTSRHIPEAGKVIISIIIYIYIV